MSQVQYSSAEYEFYFSSAVQEAQHKMELKEQLGAFFRKAYNNSWELADTRRKLDYARRELAEARAQHAVLEETFNKHLERFEELNEAFKQCKQEVSKAKNLLTAREKTVGDRFSAVAERERLVEQRELAVVEREKSVATMQQRLQHQTEEQKKEEQLSGAALARCPPTRVVPHASGINREKRDANARRKRLRQVEESQNSASDMGAVEGERQRKKPNRLADKIVPPKFFVAHDDGKSSDNDAKEEQNVAAAEESETTEAANAFVLLLLQQSRN